MRPTLFLLGPWNGRVETIPAQAGSWLVPDERDAELAEQHIGPFGRAPIRVPYELRRVQIFGRQWAVMVPVGSTDEQVDSAAFGWFLSAQAQQLADQQNKPPPDLRGDTVTTRPEYVALYEPAGGLAEALTGGQRTAVLARATETADGTPYYRPVTRGKLADVALLVEQLAEVERRGQLGAIEPDPPEPIETPEQSAAIVDVNLLAAGRAGLNGSA